MRCCVPGCKNDSRHISKSEGITFHVFPIEPSLRLSWLRAVGKESWEPKERSAICSEHFLNEDLYETKSGLRKVKAGAVPLVIQPSSNMEFEDPSTLQACRICLTVEGRLYPIQKFKLDQAYQNLTGLTISDGDKMPQKLCVECAHKLASCIKFRSKTLRAYAIMLEIIQKQENLTLQNIILINRDNNKLSSDLRQKHYTPDHYNKVFDHDSLQICQVNIEDGIEIKNETENVFINEDFPQDVKEEQSLDVGDEIHHAGDDDGNDPNFDDDVDGDKDFVIDDKDFSSDDNLPLDNRRKKKSEKSVSKKSNSKIEKKESVRKLRKRQVKKDPEPKIDRRRKPFLNDDLNETLFTITDLTYSEQVAEIEKRQESSNYRNSVFKCDACYKGFLDEDAYNSHVIRHTDQCGEYECSICKTHFKHPHALRKHITAHHTQRFSCNQCPYVTTHRQTARLHERWHKGTKYQCPHCQDEFVKFTTYMGHIRIKHPSDFVCQLCGYSFVSEKGIELHKKLKHRLESSQIPDDGPFCELCNVRFVSNEALRRHIHVSARHSGNKDQKEANKPKKPRKPRETKESKDKKRERTSSRDSSEEKKRYPSQMRRAEGPIPCEQCGLQLEDSRAYHGHFRRMHPDKNRTNYPSMKSPCMCEVCGRMFQSYALLKDHRWTHTGERPFACDQCGKSFRMKQRLVAHRRVHSLVKATYVCNVCGKQFSTHSNRQRHMFIHTGLKPFKCEMCGKCFKHASEKRAHITYVHLKKPWPKRARGKRSIPRQGLQHPQMSTSGSEMDIVQPLWPACDPKLADINSMMEDKPMYYNLKI